MTDAQTYGSLLVFGAFAAAVAAPRLLDACPSCALVWYLNLEVFQIFGPLRLRTTPLEPLFGAFGPLISASLIVSVMLARVTKARIVLAFLANLSFAAVLALLYCRFAGPTGMNASLIAFKKLSLIENVFGSLLLTASFTACLASHTVFLIEVAQECGRLRRALPGLDRRFADAASHAAAR